MNCLIDRRFEGAPVHLVIIELHYHAELIKTLYQTLTRANFKITLVTLPGVFEKTALPSSQDDERFCVYLKPHGESIADFLGGLSSVFRSADVIYLNTIRHYWRELNEIPLEATSIVRIHNAHCDFAKLSHFHRPLINSFSILSHFIRKVFIGREWKLKESLFKKIDYFMFPNQTITDYVVGNKWVDPEKVLPPILPFGFLGEKKYFSRKANNPVVTIAITGKVTNSKKDFNLVYEALKKCIVGLKFPIKLVLLGNAGQKHARPIIKKYKNLEGEKFSLDYSECYVSADVFDEKVMSVDFFIAPIQVNTHFRKHREVYGKSKMSGIENDILIHRKPSLVVSGYRIKGSIEGVVEYFDPTPDSLAEKITEWVNERRFDILMSNFSGMQNYDQQAIADNFYNLCQELILRKTS